MLSGGDIDNIIDPVRASLPFLYGIFSRYSIRTRFDSFDQVIRRKSYLSKSCMFPCNVKFLCRINFVLQINDVITANISRTHVNPAQMLRDLQRAGGSPV